MAFPDPLGPVIKVKSGKFTVAKLAIDLWIALNSSLNSNSHCMGDAHRQRITV
jgi:hypothetical protein